MTVGDRIRSLRQLVPDLTGRELSTLAGLDSPTHVGLLEAGRRKKPAATTLVGIARVFGVSVEWLVDGTPPAPEDEEIVAAVERARNTRAA
jgi:transcriptional regulator with XRE-family HTH domain